MCMPRSLARGRGGYEVCAGRGRERKVRGEGETNGVCVKDTSMEGAGREEKGQRKNG